MHEKQKKFPDFRDKFTENAFFRFQNIILFIIVFLRVRSTVFQKYGT